MRVATEICQESDCSNPAPLGQTRCSFCQSVYRSCLDAGFEFTGEQYRALLRKQHGVCAICHEPERRVIRGRVNRLSIDHCHTTGRVRGLLCTGCNRGLGYFSDNPHKLKSALKYIVLHRMHVPAVMERFFSDLDALPVVSE